MKWRNGAKVAVILLLVVAVGSVARAVKVCPSYYTVALPNYNGGAGLPGALYGGYPKVAGWNVVWTEWTPDPLWGFNKEIFLFDGNSTTQLTSTTTQYGNFGPFVSDANNVVYIGDS
ncbi:MAG: hypothetical protein ACYTEQ_07995, partial [Planctomycetota bacterium]